MKFMKDLMGQRFGRQVVIKRAGINKFRNILWLCHCDCGKEHIVPSEKLIQGKSKSCGCLAHDIHVKQFETHGITTGGKPRTFIIWNGMKARCLNPKSTTYPAYGGRGILVCKEWLTFENFHNWAMANGYADNLTIDRIDNNGNYEPDNCRWLDAITNRKMQRSAKYITICGITKNISDWCKELNISKTIAYKYLHSSNEAFIQFCKGQQYLINKFLGESLQAM